MGDSRINQPKATGRKEVIDNEQRGKVIDSRRLNGDCDATGGHRRRQHLVVLVRAHEQFCLDLLEVQRRSHRGLIVDSEMLAGEPH